MLSEARIQSLHSDFHGRLLCPQDANYESARKIWNLMINRRPALIAQCADAHDAVQAVRFARENSLVVSIRGGGHNVAGNAVCDGGLMIDFSQMKRMRVDPEHRIAEAEPGLTLGEFDLETQKYGLVTPMGAVTMTGIAGLTLGGGIGWLSGKYGLTCDNLDSVDVVTADGELRTASAAQNEDLFWAMRGAGANFGVVTSFRYRLHPLSRVLGGMVIHPMAKAREALRFYSEFAGQAPDELVASAGILTGPEGQPVVATAICYCGSMEQGEKVVAPLRKFGSPLADTIAPMPYLEIQKIFDSAFPPNSQNYWKAAFVSSVREEVIDAMIEYTALRPSPANFMVFDHLHGAVARVPVEASAFPHRDAGFSLLIIGIWPDVADTEANVNWARGLCAAVEPFGKGAVYVNYMSQEAERVCAAYGSNYDRLVALKNKYDPDNFFRMNQNIRPTTQVVSA